MAQPGMQEVEGHPAHRKAQLDDSLICETAERVMTLKGIHVDKRRLVRGELWLQLSVPAFQVEES